MARESLDDLLRGHAKRRGIYRGPVAWLGGEAPLLRFSSYDGEGTGEKFLARCDDHGERIEWPTPAEGSASGSRLRVDGGSSAPSLLVVQSVSDCLFQGQRVSRCPRRLESGLP